MTSGDAHQIGGLDVSRETLGYLERFESLVRKWNPAINLVSAASLADIRNRHTADSAQLFRLCPQPAARWVDIGTGGGFPGLVVAIIARELHPGLRFTLVESDARKATFLRQAAHDLDLEVSVLTERIERLASLNADVLSARALAPLALLLAHAGRHLRRNGVAIFPKGERHTEELAEARLQWHFEVEQQPSRTDSTAAILVIRNIERAKQND